MSDTQLMGVEENTRDIITFQFFFLYVVYKLFLQYEWIIRHAPSCFDHIQILVCLILTFHKRFWIFLISRFFFYKAPNLYVEF